MKKLTKQIHTKVTEHPITIGGKQLKNSKVIVTETRKYTIANWRKEVDSFLELASEYAKHIKLTEVTAVIYAKLAYWVKK